MVQDFGASREALISLITAKKQWKGNIMQI
jgi:hypothetical protein